MKSVQLQRVPTLDNKSLIPTFEGVAKGSQRKLDKFCRPDEGGTTVIRRVTDYFFALNSFHLKLVDLYGFFVWNH
jgi:hypothetical protein